MSKPKIGVKREMRDCESNRERVANRGPGIIYDFAVYVDGERRGTLHKIVYGGRGYELYDLNSQRVGSWYDSCDKQEDFEEFIRDRLALIPTVEQAFWNAMRDGEDIVASHMEVQARAEAWLFGRHGWRLLQALKEIDRQTGQLDGHGRSTATISFDAIIAVRDAIAEAQGALDEENRRRDELHRLMTS